MMIVADRRNRKSERDRKREKKKTVTLKKYIDRERGIND